MEMCRLGLGSADEKTTEVMRKILQFKTIAVVGMSPKEDRASYVVGKYLAEQGYDVIPVRPGITEIAGLKAYPTLKDIDRPVEVVDVFRNPADCVPIVEDAIAIGAKAVWLQEGVVNEEAARLAEKAGLMVVMDYCLKKAHQCLS